jgi:hypothetical protein
MSNNRLLEEAFAYAASGKALSISDIRAHLAGRGYSQAEVSQLSGHSLSKQLLDRIKAAAKSQA